MAYPTINGPYGLLPQNLIGGQVFAGSTRMVPIASGYGTSLNFGDPVKLTSTGTLITSGLAYSSNAAETGGTIGIFLGCEYTPGSTASVIGTGPLFGKNRYQNWAASTVAADAVAYVCDDYDVIMKAAMIAYNTGATPVISAAPSTAFGTNLTSMATATANTGAGTGNAFGNSNVGLMLSSTNDRRTTTAPFRIVGFVPETQITTTSVGTASSGSTALTLTAANTLIVTGMLVTGTGIAAGTVVQAVSGTSVTLSANTSAAISSGTLTFSGYQEVLVKWNFGYHAYQVAVAV
jgi:hypothetical protein